MAETTNISWTDATWNPWMGCAKVSPGCEFCYASVSTPARTMNIIWGPNESRKRTSASNWLLPRRWNAGHPAFFAQHGRRRRVFSASLADIFDNRADPQWRAEFFELVKSCPNLDFLVLTKRVGNVQNMLPDDWGSGYPNVWLGISVVNQEEADRDIKKLMAIPARTRFLSMEPLLGPVTLSEDVLGGKGQRSLDWVIVGGESGPNARPMDPQWAIDIRRQCNDAGVAYFFKQHGGTDKDKGGCELAGSESKEWPLAA